ncbi:hypothetical protein C8R47DRAFT_1230258 [Mycena vitilis]|nr:hypothetical protein C8R47DRAFT_1230258 [Mycena vitilis]
MTNDLTPAELAQRLASTERIPPRELEKLLGHLSTAQLEAVVDVMGLGELARELPPVLLKVLLIYQRRLATKPAEDDDDIDALIRKMDAAEFLRNAPKTPPAASPELPPSSPELPPSSPELPPSPPAPRASRSTPSTPARRKAGYDVVSPTKTGRVVSWLEAGSLTQGVRGASVKSSGSRARRRSPCEAYVVFYGGEIGAFKDWADVQRSITGNGIAIHAGFPSMDTANAAIDYARARGWTGDSTTPPDSSSTPLPLPSSYADNPLTCGATDLWYAVCRDVVPGVYRTYLECALNTVGIKGNLCASFPSMQDAEAAFASAHKGGILRMLTRPARRS